MVILMKKPLTLVEYNDLKRQLCLSKQKVRDLFGRRNTFGDVAKLQDEVLVYEAKKLKFASKGHIVNQGLIHLINAISASGTDTYNTVKPLFSYNWTAKTSTYMRLGTGSGVTQGTTTNLTSPVSTGPDSQSGATSGLGNNSYRVAWSATWNAGTLTAITVTELGLFLYLTTTLQSFGWGAFTSSGNALFSRLSVADGDFTSFQVNTSVPLTVEWRLTLSFV